MGQGQKRLTKDKEMIWKRIPPRRIHFVSVDKENKTLGKTASDGTPAENENAAAEMKTLKDDTLKSHERGFNDEKTEEDVDTGDRHDQRSKYNDKESVDTGPERVQREVLQSKTRVEKGRQRHMATFDWDKKLPLWMYGSIHDPEVVFHRLKVDDKEVLQLVQLMVADAIAQMKDDSTVGRELLMAELAKISDTQRYQDNFNCCLLVFFGLAGSTIYFETEKLKVQMVEITGNLTANAGEIVAELAEAIKHACPFFLGGHPFVFKQKWLKPKDANEGGGAPKEGGGAPKEGGDAQEGGDAPEEGWVSLIWRKCVGRKDAKEVGDAPIDGAKN